MSEISVCWLKSSETHISGHCSNKSTHTQSSHYYDYVCVYVFNPHCLFVCVYLLRNEIKTRPNKPPIIQLILIVSIQWLPWGKCCRQLFRFEFECHLLNFSIWRGFQTRSCMNVSANVAMEVKVLAVIDNNDMP